jgi:dihydrofolate reductase
MNTMPKFVASRTLDKAEWNATIIKGDLATEVRKLKDQSGADLLIYGSGDLVDELTRLGLIDEYRLMVYPVIVGSGKRFLQSQQSTTNLKLVNSVVTPTGVISHTYTRAAA